MSNEERTYLRLCKLAVPTVKPNNFIINALKLAAEKGELDLSNKTETTWAWETIGRIICNSPNFHTLTFRDCLIPSQAFASMISNLCQNSVVRSIDLRGNNIQTASVAHIGKLLRHNASIITLSLEWNSLGAYPDSFGLFCDALAINETVQFLDLKNNQISADCSSHLANVIRKNSTLKVLDLRWNTLNIKGGQHLHSALQQSKSLHRIKVQGNNIPEELAKSIEQIGHHNESNEKLKSNCQLKTDFLVQHLKESEGSLQELRKENEEKVQEILRESKNRINKMDVILAERDEFIAQTKLQVEAASAELKAKERKIRELEETLIEKEMHIEELMSIKKKDFVDFQKKLSAKEAELATLKMETDSTLAAEKKLLTVAEAKLEVQAKELEIQEIEIRKHGEKLRLSRHEHDELIQKEHSSHHETLLKLEREHEANLTKLHNEMNFVRSALQERVKDLEKQLDVLEKKKSDLSSLLLREQTKCEESVAQAVQQCRAREEARVAQLDDRLAAAREEKAALDKQLALTHAATAQLQAHNAALVAEMAEPQRRLGKMHEDLSAERITCQRLRQELADEATKTKTKQSEIEVLQSRMQEMQRSAMEEAARHAEAVGEGRAREGKLEAVVAERERELNRARQDEVDRAAALNLAFSKYLGSLSQGPVPGTPSRHHSRSDTGDHRRE